VGVGVGVANFFYQSIGIDETNTKIYILYGVGYVSFTALQTSDLCKGIKKKGLDHLLHNLDFCKIPIRPAINVSSLGDYKIKLGFFSFRHLCIHTVQASIKDSDATNCAPE